LKRYDFGIDTGIMNPEQREKLTRAASCLKSEGTPATEKALIYLEQVLLTRNSELAPQLTRSPQSHFVEVLDCLSSDANGVRSRVEKALNSSGLIDTIESAQDLGNIAYRLSGRNVGKKCKDELAKALRLFGVEARH
jgi:hypothetical protein